MSSSSDISPQRTIEISSDSSLLSGIYSQKEEDGESSKQIAQKKASVTTVEVIDETTPTEMPNADDKCTVPSLAYNEMQGTCTYVKLSSNIDSSQESVDRSVEILSENEKLKAKISALEKENTKYKQEIDYIEQCKACGTEIMKRHHEKSENKNIQKSATDSESKNSKHVSFESDCQKQMKEKSMQTSGKEDDDPKITEICKKEEMASMAYVEDDSTLNDNTSDDNIMEITDISGNVSFIKVHASPELQQSILKASVHLEKIYTSDHLDTSSEKVEKKKRKGAPNCIICKAKFADKQSLTNHIPKKHKRKTVNECVHCYKSFSSCKSLNIHIDREHYDLKSYGHKYP